MFASIFGFELRYQLRNPVFVVTSLVFFLLTFGSVTIDNIQIGAGGNIHVNSPVAIAPDRAHHDGVLHVCEHGVCGKCCRSG